MVEQVTFPYSTYDLDDDRPMHIQMADMFEALGTPKAIHAATQLREGDPSASSFGSPFQIESYYQRLRQEAIDEAEQAAGGLSPAQVAPGRIFGLPPMEPEAIEGLRKNIDQQEKNLRAQQIVSDWVRGDPKKDPLSYGGSVISSVIDREDDPDLGPGDWNRFVVPNIEDTWKLFIAKDRDFPNLPFEERRKLLSDENLGGKVFGQLDREVQDEAIIKLSDPILRDLPSDAAVARELDIPLRPARVDEVVADYGYRMAEWLGVRGLSGFAAVLDEWGNNAGVLAGTIEDIGDKLQAGAEASKELGPDVLPALGTILKVADATGYNFQDSSRMLSAYVRKTEKNARRLHDEVDIDLPGVSDDIIEYVMRAPVWLTRIGLESMALGPKLGLATLPLDAYLSTKDQPEEVRNEAVKQGMLFALMLRANGLLKTKAQRVAGATAGFTVLGNADLLGQYVSDPSNFKLREFSDHAGQIFSSAAEGAALEAFLGHRMERPPLRVRERGRAIGEAIYHLTAGQNRHRAAQAFGELSIPDRVALSRMLTPRMREGLRQGSRDIGLWGGSGVDEPPEPPRPQDAIEQLTASQVKQERIGSEARRRISIGEVESLKTIRDLEGRPIGVEDRLPKNLLEILAREPETAKETRRWLRGDGTFQDLLVTEVAPPTQKQKDKDARLKGYSKEDLAFELQPDPNNPPGFVSVYEPAAKRRVRMHVDTPEKIAAARPKNDLQVFVIPDHPSVNPKWRGRTIVVGNHTIDSITNHVDGNLTTSFSEAHDWYRNLERAIPDFTESDEAAAVVTKAWAPTQRNDSPKRGFGSFLRAWEQLSSKVFADGERVKKAGVAHGQISRALTGIRNYYRDSSKIADFSDLLYDAMPGTPRMHARTSAGGDPRALEPVAVDVHVARARGYVDNSLKKTLIEQLTKAGDKQQAGRAAKLKTDFNKAPSEFQYENTVRFVNELSKKWRDDGFHPEVDHYPGGAQAVLWDAGSQYSLKSGAESPYDIIDAHRRTISVEVVPSESFTSQAMSSWGNLYSRLMSLTPKQQVQVANSVGDWASGEIMSKVGVIPFGRERDVGLNAWESKPGAGNVLAVYSSPEASAVAANIWGWAARQDSVWSWRPSLSATKMTPGSHSKGIAIRIVDAQGDALQDTDTRIQLFNDIHAAADKWLEPGFTTTRHASTPRGWSSGDRTSIVTIVTKDGKPAGFRMLHNDLRKGGKTISAIIDAAAKKRGLNVRTAWSYVDVSKAEHDWTADKSGGEYVRRIRELGRGDVLEWMVGEFGPEYERRLTRAIEAAEGKGESYRQPLAAGPTREDFLRRRVYQEMEDPNMPPVAPAYREKANPDVIYAAKPGQLHRDAARAHNLGPKAHVDPSLESGFVDIRTGNWLTRKEADDFLPEWLKEQQRRGRSLYRAVSGEADASDFQVVRETLERKARKARKGKLPKREMEELGDIDMMMESVEPRRKLLMEADLIPAVKDPKTGKIEFGVRGQDMFHTDVLLRRRLDAKKYSEHGFINASSGEWVSQKDAEKMSGVRRVSPKKAPITGGAGPTKWNRPFPRPGVGTPTRRVLMPPELQPTRGVPGRPGLTRNLGPKPVPAWMNSTGLLGPKEQAYVESVLYGGRRRGETEAQAKARGTALERRRRGQTNEQITEELTIKLADKYGVTPEQYMAATQGTILTREQQMLGADFYHAASEVAREAEFDLQEAAKAGDVATVEHARSAIAAMNTKRAKLLMTLYASRSEAARTLGSHRDLLPKANRHARRALKMVMENEDLPEGAKQRLVDRVINAGDDAEVTRVLWDAYKPGWWDKFTEARIAFMLSSPVTIGRNLFGNAAHVAMKTVEEMTGTGIDILYETLARSVGKDPRTLQYGDRRRLVELAAMHYGQGAGLMSGLRYAKAIIVDPKRTDLAGGDNRSFLQRIADAEANQAGSRVQQETAMLPAIEGAKGAFIRLPFRLQAMGDVLFYEMGRLAKMHQLAMRYAMRSQFYETISKSTGKEGYGEWVPWRDMALGKSRLKWIRDTVALAEEVPPEVREAIAKGRMKAGNMFERIAAEGHKAGMEITFREPLGRVPQLLNSIRHDPSFVGKTARFVMPFQSTPINVAKMVARRVPLIAQLPMGKNFEQLKSGERAQVVESISRQLMGMILFGGLFELARNGYITGDAANSEMADQLTRIGRPPNSFVLPGVGAVDYRGWSPGSEFLSLAGNAAQRYEHDGKGMSVDMLYRIALGLVRAEMDQPFLTGIQDLSDAVQAPAGAEGDYKRHKFAERIVSSSVMPRGLAWAGRAMDPLRRSYGRAPSLGKGIVTGLLRDFPLTRQLTPEYVDSLGRTHATPEGWLKSMVIIRGDKPYSALDGWINTLHDPLRPDTAVIHQVGTKALGRIIDQTTRNEMHRQRAERLVPKLERLRKSDAEMVRRGKQETRAQVRDRVERAVRNTSEVTWNSVIPKWELAHLDMEDSPTNVKTMRTIIDNGAQFYTRAFRKDSERRTFVEGVRDGKIDLGASIQQEKVVYRQGARS